MMNRIILVDNLTKSFKEKEVLKDVSFSVLKGQIFCLLGSNGAGKTTTVRILATLAKANSGDARVCGYNLFTKANEVKERISLTGQFAAVDKMLTGRENLRLVAQLRHLKNYQGRIEQLLRDFELTDVADKIVGSYSGGMQRKIDLAMSLLGNPQIIFLDEPTTGLDPQSRLLLWKMIEDLRNSGVTIFLTTQYLEEAERLADYIAVLDQGTIVAGGTPRELKTALKNINLSEYENQMPTLEDVFLSIVNKKGNK